MLPHLGQDHQKQIWGDATLIGDEGGFAPPCDAREGVELVMEAIKTAGYEGKCEIGMDVGRVRIQGRGRGLLRPWDLLSSWRAG